MNPGLLVLRLVETGAGALGAALAVLVVLPVTTHATTHTWIQRALRCVHACTAQATARLAGIPGADPAPHIAELELLLGRARLSLAPLVHPLNPLRARKARARRVESAVEVFTAPQTGAIPAAPVYPDRSVRAEPALAPIHDLERALTELVTPLRQAPYASSTNV